MFSSLEDDYSGTYVTHNKIRSIPFSAFGLKSSVVSVLVRLMSDTRLIEPHDNNLTFVGCGLIRQLAPSTHERRHAIAPRPWQA